MKRVISKILQNAVQKSFNLKLTIQEIEDKIESPPDSLMGDFAFPCFFLSSKLKQAPNEIALKIKNEINKYSSEISEIKVTGAYLNFFVNKKILAVNIIKKITKEKDNYGNSTEGKGKKISVEFPSPNTNKPLHLGHLRNMAIGESVSRILEFSGGKVFRNSLNNDRGVHICKSMIAYEKYGNNKTPESTNKKSDHFVGDYYVLFSEKKIPDEDVQEMLGRWERAFSREKLESFISSEGASKGDKKILALWKKMNKWALDGFKETYKKYGIKLDKEYFESEIYLKGKKLVEQGLKKGIFKKKSDGSVFIDLNNEKLGEKIVLRADGTSVYITQDLYLAKLKFDELKIDSSVYVVGNEQDYHFNVLVSILKKLKFNFADKIKHLSYGMVVLP
ncbi:MAG: arginine--tRNA ligase, partial [Nanoarchaeota archaeon]|nr:arginine--tRNA ligase [Nanoarchaeota archaeon]